MHCRLVNQMDVAEKRWIARYSAGQGGQSSKTRLSRRAVFFQHGGHGIREVVDRRLRRRCILRYPICRLALICHCNVLHQQAGRSGAGAAKLDPALISDGTANT